MKRAPRIAIPPLATAGLSRPMWRGLASSLEWQIELGRIAPGTRIPSTRALARALGLSRNTVALAYDALVADGCLSSRTGDGTYVLDRAHRVRAPLWQRRRRWIRDPDGLLLSIA